MRDTLPGPAEEPDLNFNLNDFGIVDPTAAGAAAGAPLRPHPIETAQALKDNPGLLPEEAAGIPIRVGRMRALMRARDPSLTDISNDEAFAALQREENAAKTTILNRYLGRPENTPVAQHELIDWIYDPKGIRPEDQELFAGWARDQGDNLRYRRYLETGQPTSRMTIEDTYDQLVNDWLSSKVGPADEEWNAAGQRISVPWKDRSLVDKATLRFQHKLFDDDRERARVFGQPAKYVNPKSVPLEDIARAGNDIAPQAQLGLLSSINLENTVNNLYGEDPPSKEKAKQYIAGQADEMDRLLRMGAPAPVQVNAREAELEKSLKLEPAYKSEKLPVIKAVEAQRMSAERGMAAYAQFDRDFAARRGLSEDDMEILKNEQLHDHVAARRNDLRQYKLGRTDEAPYGKELSSRERYAKLVSAFDPGDRALRPRPRRTSVGSYNIGPFGEMYPPGEDVFTVTTPVLSPGGVIQSKPFNLFAGMAGMKWPIFQTSKSPDAFQVDYGDIADMVVPYLWPARMAAGFTLPAVEDTYKAPVPPEE